MVGTAVRVGVVAGLVASVLAAGGARAEAQEAEAQEAAPRRGHEATRTSPAVAETAAAGL